MHALSLLPRQRLDQDAQSASSRPIYTFIFYNQLMCRRFSFRRLSVPVRNELYRPIPRTRSLFLPLDRSLFCYLGLMKTWSRLLGELFPKAAAVCPCGHGSLR